MERQAREYAMRLVNDDDLSRSRGTVFFRLLCEGIENLGNCTPRYDAQTVACTLLVTARFPSRAGGSTA